MEGRRERKVVTVLFADLVGFTARAEQLDPEDVEAILRPYHERLRRELERFGGTVEKFIGDAVMALFGAPVAHEDDPERAVRAALAIRDWAREDGEVEVRIAVNTGEALINLDARPDAGEGMASGDVVNTTARMQSAAPVNGTLVGETTYRATNHVIDYSRAESVEAKGKAERIPVWEAVQARARVGTETVSARASLVGRTRELDQLRDTLERARQERTPQLVTLVGVPGIGKSRLVYELLQIVETGPELIFWRHGRSLPYGEGVTFWALAEMVKAQAGILESDSANDAGGKLRNAVADLVDEHEQGWIEAKLRPLVGLESESELGGDRRSEGFAAWRRFFEAMAEQRALVLVFEDLHWADDDLLDFVDELADWVEGVPLLVLCTARPELLDRRPGWSGGKRNALTISLSPLGDQDTARLIAGLLNRAVLPAETQAALLSRAEGNPLYAEQFVRMVSERSGGELEVPETLQGIIAARLDSLPPEEKSLLQNAAVLGKVFWTGALSEIGGVDRVALEAQLRSLARKEFARRQPRGSVAGESEYAFGHLLVRDVAYGQIPRADRATKHRLAAQWIESLTSDRSDDRAEMLAYHYVAAIELSAAAGLDTQDLAEPARLALREAADRASALGSYRQAMRLYSAALDLLPRDDAEQPALVLRHAHACYEVGDTPDLEELASALERLAAGGRMDEAAEGEILYAKSAWTLGHGAVAEEHGDRALALVRDAPASSTKAAVLVERARLLMLAGGRQRAQELGEQGLAMAEQLGLERLCASALITLGTLSGERSLELLERGIELALELNDVQQIQRGYNNLAEAQMRQGNLAVVASLYEAARRSTERFGGAMMLRWLDAQQAAYYYVVGEWGRAWSLVDAFLSDVEAGSPHYQEAVGRWVRACIRYARGETPAALADAERGEAAARAAADPQMISGLAWGAGLLVGEGRKDEAARLIDDVIATGFFDYYFVLDVGLVMADLGRGDEFGRLAARAQLTEPWAEAARALAASDYAGAADQFGAMGVTTYEARARLRAVRDLVAAGRRSEADVQLGRALAFYRSVGATRYIKEGEALLAASA
jgi:predicted ATPase/class 3 adenylate cyclase